MAGTDSQSTFPAGGAYFNSPADQGTAHRPGKSPKQRTPLAFQSTRERRARDVIAKKRSVSGTPARGKAAAGTVRGQTARTDFEEGPMDSAQVQSALHLMITDAVQYVDQELSPQRAKLADFYAGRPLGNEEDGRSQFIMTVVRDTINRIRPSLMRIFFGADHAVDYAPRRADQVEVSEQMTEYVTQVVINEDNRGFQVFDEWFVDAMVKGMGIVKWWTDESVRIRTYQQSGMTSEQVEALDADAEVTNLSFDDDEHEPGYYTVEYTRKRTHRVQRFICLPPEEYLFTRGARTTSDDAEQPGVALFAGHRTLLTRSQLRAAGVSEEDIDSYAFRDASLDHNVEEISRQSIVKPEIAEVGPEPTRRALYIEAFPYLDVDGDGIAELRRVICLGPSYTVISDEPWDERPFAVISPDPQPHTIIGLGTGDYTWDLQKVMSMVARSALDSLALSVNPRVTYVEGEVSLEDILNNDVGAPVRASQPGMVEPWVHQFVGKDAIDVLMTFFDEVLENRVGVSKDTAGLNPETLQSTTAIAISASVTAAQQHIEMMARIFAEFGVKPLMRGLLRECVKHPSPGRVIKLRGDYVPVDPKAFDADLDVRVNVAIGAGLDNEKIDFMLGVIAKQEELMKNLGLNNPVCDLERYVKTLLKVSKLRGRMDAGEFFAVPPKGWQPPPQPNPEQIKAQAEQQRAQADVARRQAEIQHGAARVKVDEEKAQAEMATEAARIHLDKQKVADEHETALEKIRANHEAKMEELQLEGEFKAAQLAQELRLAREKHDQEMALERDRHEHEKRMRAREVEQGGSKKEE